MPFVKAALTGISRDEPPDRIHSKSLCETALDPVSSLAMGWVETDQKTTLDIYENG